MNEGRFGEEKARFRLERLLEKENKKTTKETEAEALKKLKMNRKFCPPLLSFFLGVGGL